MDVVWSLAIMAAVALLWARWSKLDLGLRRPALAGVWPWIGFFVLWCAVEWMIDISYPTEMDPAWVEWMATLSPVEELVLIVLIGPPVEELFFRGAMFAALMRRWGIWPATLVPSLLWGLTHYQFDPWLMTSIAGSGIVLAIIRWKSGSLYVPIALHMAFNLAVIASDYPPFAPAA